MEKKPEEEAILNNIETSLTGLSQSLLELGVAASEVPQAEESESKEGESSRVVSDKVQESLGFLTKLNDLKGNTELRVPLEAIDQVDQGKNPGVYTKDFIEQVAGENMFMNGKLNAVKTYQDILATGIMENFTELVQEVEKRRI
ncbi:hypothetical protein E3Q08_04007 [Wallemia mellicola]|uniref:Mediator of RNA polymerase II transcription subunit 10 n=1 Tax=Wallemia mellicola TaxID=1708541 RepID=A0A4T0R408_9BASI|nr:hypothetical protein E3Q24_03856 [Wallemia mellicola]TIB80072.1 hypothetical protein E3Q21_03936 [Wallemia mellicola]TIB83997.1 hypothetical protein E3Q20_03889 [Wallemia mellicola]TIC04345.1 hypothetical protein E3Q16_02738 [Wallemia mellicola]TIC16691.1 hypothetical protein E3Q13_02838 [Wallemia mellicola]